MTIYADYQFYKNTFKGNMVSEEDYDRWALSASAYLDYITFGRIEKLSEIPEEVKLATCAVVDAMKKAENRDGISSETVGKLTVSYNGKYQSDNKGYLYREVEPYLLKTGLLYRGVM